MEKDIIKLQETVAHLGLELSELGDEVYQQHKEIDALKKYIKIIEIKFQAAVDAGGNINQPQDDTPPPHY